MRTVVPPRRVRTASNIVCVDKAITITVSVGGYVDEVECLVLPNLGEQIILGTVEVFKKWKPLLRPGWFMGLHNKQVRCIGSRVTRSEAFMIYAQAPDDPKGRLEPLQPMTDELGLGGDIAKRNHEAFEAMLTGLAQLVAGRDRPDIVDKVRGFAEVFTEVLTNIPESRGREDCVIELKEDLLPSITPQWALLEPDMNCAVETISQLLESGVIEKTDDTLFGSPILFVPKAKGERRMCIDYRRPNTIVKLHQGHIPLISELSRKVAGHKYISAFDLTSAFHQQRIRKDCRRVTTFRFQNQAYQFKLLPFGLVVSPTIMQQTVAKLFEGIPNVLNYIDDIVIFSNTIDEHIETIEKVLTRCREKRFFLKASKCEFFQLRLKFLGYEVLTEGIRVPGDRVQAFRDMDMPRTSRDMMKALGMFNYFREFVPEYARLARPLQQYANAPNRRRPNKEEYMAFYTLVDELCAGGQLWPIRDNAPFVLQTDASLYGLGAALFQKIEGQTELYGPVAMMSKSLDKHQQMYPVRQKELLAIVLALDKWRAWVVGRPIVALTDHQSLATILHTNQRPEVLRVAAWVDRLLEFDVRIEYIKGEENGLADFLSRQIAPTVEEMYLAGIRERANSRVMVTVTQPADELGPSVETDVTVAPVATNEDPEVLAVMETHSPLVLDFRERLLESYKGECDKVIARWNRTPEEERQTPLFKTSMGNRYVVDDLLFYLGKPWVPKVLAKKLVQEVHAAAHFKVDKVWKAIYPYWTSPRLISTIRDVVASCEICLRRKDTRIPTMPLRPAPVPSEAFQRINLDYVGGLPETPKGYNAVLTVVDAFSKFAIFIPAHKNETSKGTADLLIRYVFAVFGFPRTIVSDKGSNIIGGIIPNLWKWIGADPALTSTNHPQANGLAERYNRVVIDTIRALAQRWQKNWVEKLVIAQIEHNRSYCRAIDTTPFEAAHMRQPRDIHDVGVVRGKGGVSDLLNFQETIRFAVREELEKHQVAMAARFNERHKAKEPEEFVKEELVLVSRKAFHSTHLKGWKLRDCYFGPFTIRGYPHKGNKTVVLVSFDKRTREAMGGQEIYQSVNVKHLRKWPADVWNVQAKNQPPSSAKALKSLADNILRVSYVSEDYEWIGLDLENMAEDHVAHCRKEWFWELELLQRFILLKEFLALTKTRLAVEKKRLYENFLNAELTDVPDDPDLGPETQSVGDEESDVDMEEE